MTRQEAITELTKYYKVSEGEKLAKLIQEYSTFQIQWILSVLERKGADWKLVSLREQIDASINSYIIYVEMEEITLKEEETIALLLDYQKNQYFPPSFN